MNDEICACCGAQVPEGSMACPNCLVTVKKVVTNADRIRAMRIEELAEFICNRCVECSPKTCPGAGLCNGDDGRANGLAKWLRQPVEVDDD